MRRLGVFMTVVIVLLTGCSKEQNVSDNNGTKGAITLSLSAQDDHEIVVPVKSTVESTLIPPVDSFKIEIFDESGVRIYKNKYEKTKSETIYLNGGKHKLLASHGKALGVGFDAIYFAAEEQFTINGQDIVPVTTVAKMANVKASVNFGENLKAGYSEYYARLKCPAKTKNYLEFQKNETRPGYIPAGELVFELYAKINGEWKYYPVKPMTYNPNEYVTFNVDTDPVELDMNIDITIDNTVEEIKKEFNVPGEAMPAVAPTISHSGSFDEEGYFKFIQGKNYEGTQIDILADAGIKTCIIEITSDYYSNLGLPAKVDLAAPEAEGSDILANSGVKWIKGMAGERFGAINFADLSKKITFDSGKPFTAEVKVTVTDNNDKQTVSGIYNLIHLPEITFEPQAYNAFAKRVTGLTAEVVSGVPASVGLQWSQDKKIWNEASVAEISEKTVKFNTISGLLPTTTYYFRTIYNKDEDFTSEPVALTTEATDQLDNAGFENWSDEKFSFTAVIPTKTINWYRPWLKDNQASSWWDSNAKTTLRGYYSLMGNQNSRVFPCVAYTVNDVHSGSKSAMLYVTHVEATEYDITSPGELFIGSANDDGSHKADGHSFSTRPFGLKFAYKYDSYNNETFYVKMELKANDGTILATAEKTDFPSSQTWTEGTIDVNYSDITKAVSSIYISFKASSSSAPQYREIPMNIGNNEKYSSGCNIGSILYIDSLELVY